MGKVTRARLQSVTEGSHPSEGIFNTHGIAVLGLVDDRCITIDITNTGHGRGGRGSYIAVWSPKFETDPNAHWQDSGRKTWSMQRKQWLEDDATARFGKRVCNEPLAEFRQRYIDAAITWAHENYPGLPEGPWERDPFGGYHPAGTLAALDVYLQQKGL